MSGGCGVARNPLVRLALEEDIGSGDVATQACVPASQKAFGLFPAREPLIVYRGAGEEIATVSGNARTLLECRQVALTFLQRLSGVATLARQFADAGSATRCHQLHTRKTTPGMRAGKAGGGSGGVASHRMGLYGAVLIKNSHIAPAGGVRQALERVRGSGLPGAITHSELAVDIRLQLELE